MRIGIIAPGSQGDVQPFIALGKGLINAGNVVRLVSTQNHETQVKAYGIEFWPVEKNMEDIIRSEKMRAALEGGSLLKSMAKLGKELKLNAQLLTERSLLACQGMDVVMAGISGLFTGHSIAEKLGIPFIQAYNIPFTPTSAFSGALFPNFPFHRLSHHLTRQMMWQAYRPTDSIARQQVLGLPKYPVAGPFKSESLKNGLILYGLSPAVISRPDDWGDNIHLTGFWFVDPPADWTPPSTLVEFLQAGPPPLYIGFGSMSYKNPQETTDLVVQALKKTNQRAIVFSGWGGLSKADLPDSILMIDAVPHSWLFPRVQAVIHHGGAGTTAAGLCAGVPSIIVPFHGDQPFWGKLVADLGVGPKFIPRKKLTADHLAQAIQVATTDQQMRDLASNLGAKIRVEDGVARAVELLRDFH